MQKFLLSINARADSPGGADAGPGRLGRREHAVGGGFGGMTPKFIPATRLMDASGVCILTQVIRMVVCDWALDV